MKKHLLASLCVGMLVSLPACMGSCGKEKAKEETTAVETATDTQVDANQATVMPVEGETPSAATPSEVPNKI